MVFPQLAGVAAPEPAHVLQEAEIVIETLNVQAVSHVAQIIAKPTTHLQEVIGRRRLTVVLVSGGVYNIACSNVCVLSPTYILYYS